MLTSEQITQIMKELGLNPEDQAVRKVVEQVAASKPNVTIDANFISALREELAAKANELQISKTTQHNYFSLSMNKILASALVVCLVLVAGGVWYIQNTNKPLIKTNQLADTQVLSGKYAITNVAKESFGDLAKVALSNGGQGGGGQGAGPATATDSLGSAPTANQGTKVASGPATGLGGGGANGSSPESIIYRPNNYVFKYTGADLPTLADTQNVLKRISPVQPESFVSKILSFLSFGLIDMSKFTDVKLQNFAFVEDKDFGYGMNVDMQSGTVNLYQNWQKWPQPYNCIAGEPCPTIPPVKSTDLPSDTETINIANQFLTDYNISLEGYGTPIVDDTWRVQNENNPIKTNLYVPEQVQVIYPLQLEGKKVFDEGGYTDGLVVFVDVRTKKVANVSNLNTKQFESSAYAGETSSKRLIDVALRGGYRNYPYTDPNGKKVELDLQTPTIEMVRMWYSTDNYKTTDEIYVPALVFPIKNWAETQYWRRNVVVPIVSSILDSDKQPIIYPGQPIPLDATQSSTGSAGIIPPTKGE